MTHIPFGYQIENGHAVIDEIAAKQLSTLFEEYIAGAALATAATTAGISATHSVIGRMLRNEKYLGTDFYPAIIDKELFEAAGVERMKRAKALGRVYDYSQAETSNEKNCIYHLGSVQQKYDSPFKQAEYAYSLIESEEADG